MPERSETEKILDASRPNAANRHGRPGRGDLIVPRRTFPRPINGLIGAVAHAAPAGFELGEVAPHPLPVSRAERPCLPAESHS